MAKACLRDDTPFGVCLIREGAEVGAPAVPEPVGCLARIEQWDMAQLGLLQVVARGGERFRLLERRVRLDGLALGRVALLPEVADAPVPAHLAACRELLERVAAEHGERVLPPPWRLDSCAWVGARLAEVLPLPAAARQQLLELDDGVQLLETLYALIARES